MHFRSDVPQTKVDRLVVCSGVEWAMTRTALVWAAPAGGKGCDGVTDTAVSATPSPLLVIPTDSLAAELHQHVEENFHPNLTLVPPAPPPVTRSGFVGTNKKHPPPPPSLIVDRGWASAATYPSAPIITAACQTTIPDEPSKQRQKQPSEISHGEKEHKRGKTQKEQCKIWAWVSEDG